MVCPGRARDEIEFALWTDFLEILTEMHVMRIETAPEVLKEDFEAGRGVFMSVCRVWREEYIGWARVGDGNG